MEDKCHICGLDGFYTGDIQSKSIDDNLICEDCSVKEENQLKRNKLLKFPKRFSCFHVNVDFQCYHCNKYYFRSEGFGQGRLDLLCKYCYEDWQIIRAEDKLERLKKKYNK